MSETLFHPYFFSSNRHLAGRFKSVIDKDDFSYFARVALPASSHRLGCPNLVYMAYLPALSLPFFDFGFLRQILLVPALFLSYYCLIFGLWLSAAYSAYSCLIPDLFLPILFLPYFCLIFGFWLSAAYSAYSCLIPGLFLPYFWISAFCSIFCLFLPYSWLIPALFLPYFWI